MKITFFGAVGQVTGSRYLVEDGGTKILVDCGLFQGDRKLTKRNWDEFPIDPRSIDSIILTHAHIDHTGYIPLLVKNGFTGKIYCSKATYALCEILLVDSGSLQEQEAENPLYTIVDAQRSLNAFVPIEYDQSMTIGESLTFKLVASGHILGASFVIISDGKRTLSFSGDLGRPNQLIMKSPPPLEQTDYLVLDSTYGDRLHAEGNPLEVLGNLVNKMVAKGGVLILPVFAVGRAQTILYCLYELKQKKIIPDIPIFLDSPMAIKVTNLFCNFNDEHTLPPALCNDIFHVATFIRTIEQSQRIDHLKSPSIIVAASGMASGGRVLDHLKHYISSARNTIAFVGFQAKSTIGGFLTDGAKELKIDNKPYPVRAHITTIDMFSAHADFNETLEWLSHFKVAPKKLFLTHGEPEARQSLKKKIEKRFGWLVEIPEYLESFQLD